MMTFELGVTHPNTPYLFSDLAELLLMVSWNGRTYLHKNDLESILNEGDISEDELDDEFEAEEIQDIEGLSTAEKSNRREQQLEDVISHLAFRNARLGGDYPFFVSGEKIEISSSFTDEQRIYRFLLACSRLRSFKQKGTPQRWAKTFTLLSRYVLSALTPKFARTHIFDANSDDRKNIYSTDLRKALPRLGQELGVLAINNDACNSVDAAGDGGFDLVSFFNFNDDASVNYAVLGQCGAQETGWPRKTLEAHSMHLRSYFHMQFDYPSTMLTPVLYRTNAGNWYQNKATDGILLLDRLRIIQLLKTAELVPEITSSEWFYQFETEFEDVKSALKS